MLALVNIFSQKDMQMKPTCEGLRNLLVDENIDLDASFCGGPEHVVQAVLLIAAWRATEIQLRAQPPI